MAQPTVRIMGKNSKSITRTGRSSRRLQLQRRPCIDGLERRELMTIGGGLDPKSGILTISGTGSSEVVRVEYGTKTENNQSIIDRSIIQVSMNTDGGWQVNRSFTASDVKHIIFNGKAGNDYFDNSAGIPASLARTTGTVSTSLLDGVPNNSMPNQAPVGVYTVGTTGDVNVDYLYCGAGYRGQLAMYSLSGMENFTPGTSAYNQEAARRALSGSTLGHVVIAAQTDKAKFSSSLPWEGNMNTGNRTYKGIQTVEMTPGDRFAFMLVPNGTVRDVFNNPAAGGALTPLYSIPDANPYRVTSQLLAAQAADLDGHGSLFAFEDLRLDGSSDRDYNDLVFQVTGARGTQPYVKEVQSTTKDITSTPIFAEIVDYAAEQQSADAESTVGNWSSGVGVVAADGRLGVDFLFDGGGYLGEVAVFSLQGMTSLTPGSPEFIKEAARRALSNTVLGRVVISDGTEGARTSEKLAWESNFNAGTYKGIKTFEMTAGDSFGTMLVPAGTVWEVFNRPENLDPKKRPLFSMPEANPLSSTYGRDQLAALSYDGTTFGFEDIGVSTNKSDRDFNDIVFRFIGATMAAPDLNAVANSAKNFLKTSQAPRILA